MREHHMVTLGGKEWEVIDPIPLGDWLAESTLCDIPVIDLINAGLRVGGVEFTRDELNDMWVHIAACYDPHEPRLRAGKLLDDLAAAQKEAQR